MPSKELLPIVQNHDQYQHNDQQTNPDGMIPAMAQD
jgi:hypothetical protein